MKWYRNAAEQGHAVAQYNLGCCYDNGTGVEQSDEEAAKWYHEAAEQGHADAQFMLGLRYAHGEGVEQSTEEAAKWFRKAAEQGVEAAKGALDLWPSVRKTSIQNIVKERSVRHILHFTRLENVKGIVENGLIPRAELDSSSYSFIHNDPKRLDNTPTASSLSISWPNYRMFYSYRDEDFEGGWVVLSFKPDVLWDFDCAFCFTNAASASMRSISAEDKKTVAALESMFSERKNYPARSTLGIDESFPTDPQAEVLLFGVIPSSYIDTVFVPTAGVAQSLAHFPRPIAVEVSEEYFTPRRDWRHWTSNRPIIGERYTDE